MQTQRSDNTKAGLPAREKPHPTSQRRCGEPYSGEHLSRVAFPMGGIGAGMICLEGTGALSHVSLHHRPEVFNEPIMFAALHVASAPTARVLEGPVPMWKAFGQPASGNGSNGKAYGLPRFAEASFRARFPFATVELTDGSMPVAADVTGWSPFIPGNADDTSLPVCGLEYRFRNLSDREQRCVFSFHADNYLQRRAQRDGAVEPLPGGFALHAKAPPPRTEPSGSLAIFTDDPAAVSDCAWFRGGWFDALSMIWKQIQNGDVMNRPPYSTGQPGGGGSLYVPFVLPPRGEKTLRLMLCWYVPSSELRLGDFAESSQGATDCSGEGACRKETYVPWYAAHFDSLQAVADYWRTNYDRLRAGSVNFSDCFYDTTLPPEVVEAVAANLTILKSPTCLRQHDGRFWGFEGCGDSSGCCQGSCTHVWNYAQAMPHLFSALERTLRETEFFVSQDESGHQQFRTTLPIGPGAHGFHAAADGQLGGIVKVYREWRISGDTEWMKRLWPKVRQSLDYCIRTWDPDHTGTLIEPHHNTYDVEFWGPDGMCTSFYLSALQAAVCMGRTCNDDVSVFEEINERGKQNMESDLWNGEYFFQRPRWNDLRAPDPSAARDEPIDEALAILHAEGPKYQYGSGCLSDGVLGDWLARVSGLPPVLDDAKIASHVAAVFRHNFRENLHDHANPQRPGYAFGQEGGLLLCSWPRGGKPSLPFVYSDEVWTGIEYQVASHLIMTGQIEQGLRVVRAARARYDGRVRNPFNEYECGHWYARAMSSYALLQALSGARYDAVERTLYLSPAIPGDSRAFLATATGYGTVGLRNGEPFLEVRAGDVPVNQFIYHPLGNEDKS